MRHFSKPHQYYSIISQHNTNTTMTFQYYLNTTSTLHKRFQYYSILQKRPVNTTSILHCTFWTSILLNTTNTTEVQYYKIINTTQYYQYYQYVWGQLADVVYSEKWHVCADFFVENADEIFKYESSMTGSGWWCLLGQFFVIMDWCHRNRRCCFPKKLILTLKFLWILDVSKYHACMQRIQRFLFSQQMDGLF